MGVLPPTWVAPPRPLTPPTLQASDRVYYLYQTVADIEDALSSTPEGAAALEDARRQLGAAAPQQARQAQQQQPEAGGKAGKKKAAAMAASSPGVELLGEVRAAMADDFNTPLAIAALSAPLKAANDLLHTKQVRCAGGGLCWAGLLAELCCAELCWAAGPHLIRCAGAGAWQGQGKT